jgi:hypothetical protein
VVLSGYELFNNHVENSTSSYLFMFILFFCSIAFGFYLSIYESVFMDSQFGRNLQRGDCSFIFS